MADDRIEKALALARRIDQLRDKERDIRTERERLEAEFGTLVAPGSARPTPVSEAGTVPFIAGSLASRVMKVLEAEPGRVFNLEEIAKALSITRPKKLSSTLNRLKDLHRIQHAGRGQYSVPAKEVPVEKGRHVA